MSHSDFRLYIETSGQMCSIALYNQSEAIGIRESEREKSHASLITRFIKELIKEAKIKLSELRHIVVSSGPGSYTGLRVGYSTAKGICYALSTPLVAVNSLEAMAYGLAMKHSSEDYLYCPIVDARRMEVYTALYDKEGSEIIGPQALILDENFNVKLAEYGKKVIFGGSGVEKLKEYYFDSDYLYDTEITASAHYLDRGARVKIEDKYYENLAYSEPFYLKSVYIKK